MNGADIDKVSNRKVPTTLSLKTDPKESFLYTYIQYMRVCVHTYMYGGVCLCLYVYMYICVYICKYVCVRARKRTRVGGGCVCGPAPNYAQVCLYV